MFPILIWPVFNNVTRHDIASPSQLGGIWNYMRDEIPLSNWLMEWITDKSTFRDSSSDWFSHFIPFELYIYASLRILFLLLILLLLSLSLLSLAALNLYQKCLRYTLHSNPCCQLSIHHVFCSLSYLVSSHFRLIVTRRKAMYSHETILSVYKNYTNPVQREWFVLWAILYHHFSICWSLRGESIHSRDIFIM